MADESRLDQIVKGASLLSARSPSTDRPDQPPIEASTPHLNDPYTSLPSSPPQIYLNLLILEASLRSQYLAVRNRRRQSNFFLLLLSIWTAYFFYALFLRPGEDGSGIGGSAYWVIEMAEKVALMGGVATGILLWGTGQWERGIRWPRRWLFNANRGLRSINTKLVVINGPWWMELFSKISFLFPYSLLFPSSGMSIRFDDPSAMKRSSSSQAQNSDNTLLLGEEDLTPGGDHVKLLLLPKAFSPDFREKWESYRAEYWEKENERRSQLRQKLLLLQRELAKQEASWLWAVGWRGWRRAKGMGVRRGDVEKPHHHRHHYLGEKEAKHRHSNSIRDGSHSRNSSRSSTPTYEGEENPTTERVRRGSSTASSAGDRRKKKPGSTSGSQRVSRLSPANSRPSTPVLPETATLTRKQSSGLESDKG
ncbi:MAG: hypothetical protein M1829_005511 [Trizodia sp. TS-e1964]|nr:MAG: hypothetical protein M1829_005511 [Trizodia sp. TS-e1964]